MTDDLYVDSNAWPVEARQYLALFDSPLPSSIFSQDSFFMCDAARQLHQSLVLTVRADVHDADALPMGPFPGDLYAAIVHQATEIRRARRVPGHIVLPEVVNMLVLILRHVYPLHELRISTSYAVAKPRLSGPVWTFRRDLTTALRMAASFTGARAPTSTSTSSFFLHLKGPTPAIDQAALVPKSVQTAVATNISTLPRNSTTLASAKLYGPLRAAIPKWMLSIEPVSDTTSNWSALETQAPREQQSSLGVRGPLVGLLCEKTSAIIQPVVGWSDNSHTEDENELLDCGSPTCIPPNPSEEAAADRINGGEQQSRSRHRLSSYFFARRVVKMSTLEDVFRLPDAYVNATALVCFGDNLLSSMPKQLCPNPHLHEIIRQLDCEYQSLIEKDQVIGLARPAVQAVIKAIMCSILHVVATARDVFPFCEDTADTNETAYRHLWDQLIALVVNACTSPDISFYREAELFLPENPVVAEPKVADEIRKKCVETFSTVHPPSLGLDSYRETAYIEWTKAHTTLLAILKSGSMDAFNAEPIQAVADGFLALSVADAYSSDDVAEKTTIFAPPPFRPPEDPGGSGRSWPPSATPQVRRFKDSAFRGNAPRRRYTPEEKLAYGGASPDASNEVSEAATAAGDEPVADAPPAGPDCPQSLAPLAGAHRTPRTLDLGLLSIEHTKFPLQEVAEEAATDQSRLCQAAMVTHTRLFGITRFPVFGIITRGFEGVMTCAWADETVAVKDIAEILQAGLQSFKGPPETYKSEVTVIADQHVTLVDIRSPADVLNIATFIAYIVCEHGPLLRRMFCLRKESGEIPLDLKQYLGTKQALPFDIARAMKPEDGKWRKTRIQNLAESKPASTATTG
ncbi:hypothetical protein K466DRAFT_603971 [Polyporus arcularius HHB13444]|uniref:Uncharacterized protein n=1 Tax=Polyporus arcularius HHB13444 TaxID=1314778 RepID=A0A5C3NXF7_9APHY|nr:hypothetical protein K466DRAFT_603971 [Polyporus arcularius HHB13444]